MAPDIYYRVHDESSATHFDEDGFVAGDHLPWLMMHPPRNPQEDKELFNALDEHLDWSSETASPFISAYADEDTAVNSAVARVNQGKEGVFIAVIDVEERREPLWFRHVPKLAKKVGLWIEPQAWNNSKYEYIFLNYIPGEVIVEYRWFK